MLVVTPNPAIDHTVHLARLGPGEVMRAYSGVSVAGGKGGNVSRAAGLLGTATTVVAFVGNDGGAHLQSLYAAEGFELVAVPVAGRVRTCTAMIEDDGRVTLVNEPGADIDSADWSRLMTAVAAQLGSAQLGSAQLDSAQLDSRPGNDIVVCSGSLPPGAPADGYAQVVRAGHDAGAEVLVDVSGPALLDAIRAGADLVCPNVSEAETALAAEERARHGDTRGASYQAPAAFAPEPMTPAPESMTPAPELMDDDADDVPDRARAAAAGLLAIGARWAVVTAGSAGAAIAGPDHQSWLTSPRVDVKNPIGAGDSFLAGAATARLAGREWPAAIRRGLASGSASVEQAAAGVVDPARVDALEALIDQR